MPITSMLRQLRPVIAREPAIFVKALAATCHVEEWGNRAMVMLRSNKQAWTHTQCAAGCPSLCTASQQGVCCCEGVGQPCHGEAVHRQAVTDALHRGTAVHVDVRTSLVPDIAPGGFSGTAATGYLHALDVDMAAQILLSPEASIALASQKAIKFTQ